jgi:3-oxoacyl-[acyl-carrier protein] reductase
MQPKITLITGSSKGIGKYMVEHYLKLGHKVIGCSRTNIEVNSENYSHIPADISNERDVKKIIHLVKDKYGRLDNLINNAGVAAMNHALLTPIDTVNRLLSTNFVGTFLMSRESAKLMARNNFGRIVNFVTVAVPLKIQGEAVYAASKAAVLSLTQILAHEFSKFNITVNAIGPTPVETDLIRNIPKGKINALIEKQAIPRLGNFIDITNVVDFFIQENSNFITGQTLYLGGVS